MPDHLLCPPHDLPPTPCEGFFYCPDPLALTDTQLDALFPREQRLAFIRDVARLTHSIHSSIPAPALLEKARANGR